MVIIYLDCLSYRCTLRSLQNFLLLPIKIPLVTPILYHIINRYTIDKQITETLVYCPRGEHCIIECKRDFFAHRSELS